MAEHPTPWGRAPGEAPRPAAPAWAPSAPTGAAATSGTAGVAVAPAVGPAPGGAGAWTAPAPATAETWTPPSPSATAPVFRAAPPPFRLSTPEGVDVRLRLADPGIRFAALLVDAVVQVLLAIVLALGAVFLAGLVGGSIGGLLGTVLASSLFLLVLIGHPMAWELLNDGRSPGQLVTRTRVVRTDGRRIDATASLSRNASRLVELPLLYVPALVLSVATRHNQRLGDLVAGTLVVHAPRVPRRILSDAARAESERAAGGPPTGAAAAPGAAAR